MKTLFILLLIISLVGCGGSRDTKKSDNTAIFIESALFLGCPHDDLSVEVAYDDNGATWVLWLCGYETEVYQKGFESCTETGVQIIHDDTKEYIVTYCEV